MTIEKESRMPLVRGVRGGGAMTFDYDVDVPVVAAAPCG